ncbi:DUF3500 domain-containing protein [Fuerstiella marisgermanici]|uniref:DUF3500 domain-containing protein n=1 Tax=Fuerstiella marisgermanici TaxID=1891926 RepID=A0A1P8WMK3_9PLAN|nr:DUF3500 domain-containing protein [Fuerstiella marisgermanici]APZ95279.1 hypothetical protein Fuma_04935 [Fuerstiella marisgermanici]
MATSPNTESSFNRRNFVKLVGGTSALAALSSTNLNAALFAGPSPSSAAETAVTEFYKSLSDAQKSKICFGFNNKLRDRISANWMITDIEIGSDFYTKSQRKMIDQVVRGLTSEDGYSRLQKQMEDDNGGLEQYSVAVFGTPGEKEFEFELTGRHLTLRADGNSVEKAAFGGPIVYGHGEEEDVKKNLYYDQTKQTNEVFKSLDADQAARALVAKKPSETAVQIQGDNAAFPGIAVSDLKDDQQQLVLQSLKVLLAPYREEDRAEVMQIVAESGGVEKLHMAFYQEGDLESDKVWDIWRVEGPAFVWHFRGAPHVHAYINIGHRKHA